MLSLTCAISDYDHVRDLASGRIRAEGIALRMLDMPVEEAFFRMIRFEEFDLSEMSMGRYVSMVSQGDDRFVAIPVFPSRMFRHSSIYVRKDRGINAPEDLAGRSIGVPEWAQTAGIYMRGILAHHYGVALEDINWVQAGIHQAGREEEVRVQLPDGYRLTRIQDRTLNDMLVSGEIDAVMSAHPPHCTQDKSATAGRLFEDFQSAERRFWETTGIFPIMHAVVLRRPVFEQNRWIAANLLAAFTEAKERSIARLKEVTAARFPLPWSFEYFRQTAESFGPDYWAYGIEPNLTTLKAFLSYAAEQGVTRRLLSVDDLFPPEVRKQFKI
jgi:4,5-dihydroxyphthalate decarboxylase